MAYNNMQDEHGYLASGLMPSSFPAPIAAKLLRTTPESLASLTRVGAIMAIPGARASYSRGEVERILGRALTLEEYRTADDRHEPRRAANRRYNRKRRGRGGSGNSSPVTQGARS